MTVDLKSQGAMDGSDWGSDPKVSSFLHCWAIAGKTYPFLIC